MIILYPSFVAAAPGTGTPNRLDQPVSIPEIQDKFSCSDNLPESREAFSALVDRLSPVWEAVSKRDEAAVMEFLHSENPFVRETAWRGLANMPVASQELLFDLAMKESLDIKWFALSQHNLAAGYLRELEDLVSEGDPAARSGVYLVLGQKGDAVSHHFLAARAESVRDAETGYALGLAFGRSILRNRDQQVPDMLLLERAMTASDSKEQAAWMYPWYRSLEVKPSAEALNLLGRWTHSYFDEAYGLVRQYMITILGRSTHPSLIAFMNDFDLAELHPLEAVELARALAYYAESDEIARLRLRLWDHPNPYVRIELLQSIQNMRVQPADMYKDEIISRLAGGVSDAFEWMWHVRALGKWWPHEARAVLDADTRDWPASPHYTNDYLETLKPVYSAGEFLEKLMEMASGTDDAVLVPVIGQATTVAMQSPENADQKQVVASILIRIAGNDSYRISQALSASNQPMDWKNTESDSDLLAHIAKGEALGAFRPALNIPDADRIKALGSHPIWVLRTDLGDIVMRLDSYRAPATVSTFAGLVEDGWYAGTPFHRVVHNFVVQAGAIWSSDYTLADPFRVPTEGTEMEFSRGAVGVASSGRDTETSQFFMMHQWAPHLNGAYSNIGRVVEGEDVIDRLTQGTMVLGSSMYGCY